MTPYWNLILPGKTMAYQYPMIRKNDIKNAVKILRIDTHIE